MKPSKSESVLFEELGENIPRVFPLIESSSMGYFYAPPGIGKTWLSLELNICLTTGLDFFGLECPNPCKTIFVDSELGKRSYKKRSVQLIKNRGGVVEMFFENSEYLGFEDSESGIMPNLADYASHKFYSALLDNNDVMIIDNLIGVTRSTPQARTYEDQWLVIQDWVAKQRKRNKTIIFIHHENKSGGEHGTILRRIASHFAVHLMPPVYPSDQKNCFRMFYEKGREYDRDKTPNLFVEYSFDENDCVVWTYDELAKVEINQFRKAVIDFQSFQSACQVCELTQKRGLELKLKLEKSGRWPI